MIKKIKSIYPYYFVAFIPCFIINQCVSHASGKEVVKHALFSWSELFFLRMSGIVEQLYNGPAWYLSAMLMAILIVYPLLRINSNLYQYVIAPLVCVCIYGYLAQTYHMTALVTQWNGFIYSGVLRAVADLSLGCICFAVVEFIKGKRWKKNAATQNLFLAAEITLLFIIVVLMQITKRRGMDEIVRSGIDFTSVLLIALLIVFIFAREATLLQKVQHSDKLCIFLGNFSLSLYLSQRFWVYFVNFFCKGAAAPQMFAVYFTGSILSALVNMLFAQILIDVSQALSRFVKNALFE